MFLPIAGISCYLVYCAIAGDVTVDHSLGFPILIQLTVAADHILITDIYPKDQPRNEECRGGHTIDEMFPLCPQPVSTLLHAE